MPATSAVLAAIPATGVVLAAGSLVGLPGESVVSLYWKVLLVCTVLTVGFYDHASVSDPPAAASSAATAQSALAGGRREVAGQLQPTGDAGAASAAPAGQLFFQRLDAPLDGDLICLQMHDHYLAVHTTAGQQLVLCRMDDAARELHGLGQRVHRSWWVARAAIAEARRHNGRLRLILHDGREVPVGRTYQQQVRTELLPIVERERQ